MEFLGLVVPNWLLAALAILTFLYWYVTSTSDYWKDRGVPSMKCYPIFGSSIDLIFQCMHEAELKRYQKYGRVYGAYESNRPVLSVGDPELLREILIKDFPSFPGRRVANFGDKIVDNMVSVLPGEDWKRVRTIITPAFTSGKLRRMASSVNSCSETVLQNFIETAKQGSYVDAKILFGAFAMDVIVSSAFGVKFDSHNDPKNAYAMNARELFFREFNWRIALAMIAPSIMGFFKISLFSPHCTDFFREAALEIVRQRRLKGEVRNDFLQLLMDASNEQQAEDSLKDEPKVDYGHEEGNEKIFSQKYKNKGLSQDELVAQCVIFFIAGYDTTASTLSFTAYHLALNPEIQERLIAEVDMVTKDKKELDFDLVSGMKYLDQVVCETLRLYPPVVRLDRTAAQTHRLGNTGIIIPKGMILTLPTYAIHRDPAYYPDPEKYDPERFTPENKAKRHPLTFFPFGAGPRNCVGMRFGLMEVKLCLVRLLQTLRFKRCPETKVPLEFLRGQLILQAKEVAVAVEIRKDSPKK